MDQEGLPIWGKFKCGSCGVPSESFTNAPRCNQVHTDPLQIPKPTWLQESTAKKETVWSLLTVFLCKKVRRELAARKLDSDGESKEVRWCLAQHGGLQRAPLLLIGNPQHNLNTFHLEHYTVNDFKPLHVIKGHSMNLFTELPYLLPSTCNCSPERRYDDLTEYYACLQYSRLLQNK